MTKPQDEWVRKECGTDRISMGEALREPRLPFFGVLDNIRSAHNVGSMFRTADGARASRLYLCGYSPTPPHRHLAKTALGAVDVVPWRHFESAAAAIADLRGHGVHILAMEKTDSSVSLFDYEFDFPIALVMGNEADGLTTETLDLCDSVVHLPMHGLKNSLNVSVAFGIAMYHLLHRWERAGAIVVD